MRVDRASKVGLVWQRVRTVPMHSVPKPLKILDPERADGFFGPDEAKVNFEFIIECARRPNEDAKYCTRPALANMCCKYNAHAHICERECNHVWSMFFALVKQQTNEMRIDSGTKYVF